MEGSTVLIVTHKIKSLSVSTDPGLAAGAPRYLISLFNSQLKAAALNSC